MLALRQIRRSHRHGPLQRHSVADKGQAAVVRYVEPLVCVGVLAALEMGHLVESLLFGVKAADPLTLAAAAMLLIGVGLVAAYVPLGGHLKTGQSGTLQNRPVESVI